jgi:hypothetical protein
MIANLSKARRRTLRSRDTPLSPRRLTLVDSLPTWEVPAGMKRTVTGLVLLSVACLCVGGPARAADPWVCPDQVPDPKTFSISAITSEGMKNTGALTDVYFSIKNVRLDEIRKLKFHLTFSKRGEVIKTMRYEHVFLDPLRRLDVEQVHVSLSPWVGGFCESGMSSCGSISVRVIGVCYLVK